MVYVEICKASKGLRSRRPKVADPAIVLGCQGLGTLVIWRDARSKQLGVGALALLEFPLDLVRVSGSHRGHP
jgi:hypothetical protein